MVLKWSTVSPPAGLSPTHRSSDEARVCSIRVAVGSREAPAGRTCQKGGLPHPRSLQTLISETETESLSLRPLRSPPAHPTLTPACAATVLNKALSWGERGFTLRGLRLSRGLLCHTDLRSTRRALFNFQYHFAMVKCQDKSLTFTERTEGIV